MLHRLAIELAPEFSQRPSTQKQYDATCSLSLVCVCRGADATV